VDFLALLVVDSVCLIFRQLLSVWRPR